MEKTFLLIFLLSSYFFPLKFRKLSYVYIWMPRRWRTNWNLWMVLDSSSQRLASATRYRKSFFLYSTRLDRLLSSADNTFPRRSRVGPCSLKRVSLLFPFIGYSAKNEEKLFRTKLEKLDWDSVMYKNIENNFNNSFFTMELNFIPYNLTSCCFE